MKIRIFAAVLLIAVALSACTATVEGSMANPSGSTGHTAPSSTGTPEFIGEEKAKTIALQHAGLSEADVTRLKVEYELDDGIHQYDVEFHHGEYEYEYEIDATTGAILSADKDRLG